MAETSPQRLYFDTYLQLVHNSVGTQMFRNFYIEDPVQGKIDALGDGSNSCAFFVSSVLVIFAKLRSAHGTVQSTLHDLVDNNWQRVTDIQPGDVLHWAAMEADDGVHEHIGFAVEADQAVSTSWQQKQVIQHDIHFGDVNRQIEAIYRYPTWEIT